MLLFKDEPKLIPACEAIAAVASGKDHSFAFGFYNDGVRYQVDVSGKPDVAKVKPGTDRPTVEPLPLPIIETFGNGKWLRLGKSQFFQFDSVLSFQFASPGQLSITTAGGRSVFRYSPAHRSYLEEQLLQLFDGYDIGRQPFPPPASYDDDFTR